MRNVFCIGELLIDFVCRNTNVSLVNGSDFEKKLVEHPLTLLLRLQN